MPETYRHLNRLVLINSKNMPLCEICINGNVHFMGDQGVGKTTLLRALMFFYNVDTQKLGLSPKQDSFVGFYLPTSASFIIYEVETEIEKYMVIAYKQGTRVVFRIVACEYDKKFFIDDDGKVAPDWATVSVNIGPYVYKSDLIRTESGLLNILYGNTEEIDRKMRRFSLVETKQYGSLVKSMQNIFLNKGLESGMIKDMVIASLDLTGADIDLNAYQKQFANFRQRYDDIWQWYRTGKDGRVKARVDADSVLDQYNSLVEAEYSAVLSRGHLMYAMDRDRNELPILRKELDTQQAEMIRLKTLLAEEKDKMEKEKSAMNQDLGAVKVFLKTVDEKRRKYEAVDIERLLQEEGKKSAIETELDSYTEQEKTLIGKNGDIKDKYRVMANESKTKAERRINQEESRKTKVRNEYNEADHEAHSEYNAAKDKQTSDHTDAIVPLERAITDAYAERMSLNAMISAVDDKNPFKDEQASLSNSLMNHKVELTALEGELAAIEPRLDHCRAEGLAGKKDLEQERDKAVDALLAEINNISAEIAQISEQISTYDGSLGEWLMSNVDRWEESIGKVIDESLLFRHDLNPKLGKGKNDSLYGVKLDLEKIEKSMPTIAALENKVAELTKQRNKLDKNISDIRDDFSARISAYHKKASKLISDIEKERRSIIAKIANKKAEIEKTSENIRAKDANLTAWRNSEREKLKKRFDECQQLQHSLEQEKKEKVSKHEKAMLALKKDFDKKRSALLTKAKEEEAIVDKAINEINAELALELNEQEKMMLDELKGLGVNEAVLNNVRSKIKSLKIRLNEIERNHDRCVNWRRDNEEYFSKENEKKAEKKDIHNKLSELTKKYELRNKKLSDDFTALDNEVRDKKAKITNLQNEITNAETFISSTASLVSDAEVIPVENKKSISELVNEIRDAMNRSKEYEERLRVAVKTFTENFSADNDFNFRHGIYIVSELKDFAKSLEEFLDKDMIEAVRNEANELYVGTLKSLSRSIGELLSNLRLVKQLVSKIDKDFEANNFVGVIKSFNLAVREQPDDPIVQQLLRLHQFEEENNYNIGFLNLFSTAEDTKATNAEAIGLLGSLIDLASAEPDRKRISTSDMFDLEMSYTEGSNSVTTRNRLTTIGSTGTDVLLKAMVNIMLISVFKHRCKGMAKLHCMMDEIGRLDPRNEEAIIKFANDRDIYVINSSPTIYKVSIYDYIYRLARDRKNKVHVTAVVRRHSEK